MSYRQTEFFPRSNVSEKLEPTSIKKSLVNNRNNAYADMVVTDRENKSHVNFNIKAEYRREQNDSNQNKFTGKLVSKETKYTSAKNKSGPTLKQNDSLSDHYVLIEKLVAYKRENRSHMSENLHRTGTGKAKTGKGNWIYITRYLTHKNLKDTGPKLSGMQRAKFVQQRCQTFLKENNIQLDPNMRYRWDNEAHMISQRYSFSICANCKVASTNIKRVLYALDNKFTGDINSLKRPDVRMYSGRRRVNFHKVLSGKHLVRLMFVREPLERLLSAFRDKRSFPKAFRGPSFNFHQYLLLVLKTTINNMNKHIYPYFERCRPCEMQYNYIGLQDNFDIDMKMVLRKLDATVKVGIPERKKTGYSSAASEALVKSYFRKVPNDLIHKLWEKYYKDYYIFGFPYPSHLMN